MSLNPISSSIGTVMVEGAPLSLLVKPHLSAIEVDSTMFVPSQFRLTFRAKPVKILEPGGLQLGVMVTITAPLDGVPVPIMTGEITSVEVEYENGVTSTVVKGMDRSHRLMRGSKTMAYPDQLASDVVALLLGESTVVPGIVEETTYPYPWLTQANVSNWVFIQQLARLENMVAYSDPLGAFNFHPMPLPAEGDPPALTYLAPAQPTQLIIGKNLRRLRAVVSSAEQVASIMTGGYDPTMSEPVIGTFAAIPSTADLLDPATEPAVVAGEMGGTLLTDSSRPFDAEGPATKWAESIAADVAGAMAEIEGECVGNPKLVAGSVVSLGMSGPPFEGNYVVTAARHVFDWDMGGYTTWITVGGYRDRSLLALSSGETAGDGMRPNIPGLVIGTVTDNEDPEGHGRVKVMFPWLSPDYVSAWARTVHIGASAAGAGFLWMPEVGDEVLIGFDRGHIDFPYVIGNLYNGTHTPLPAPEIEGLVQSRRIVSRLGHTLSFSDAEDGGSITIGTAPAEAPPTSIKLDAAEVQITINSDGKIQITGAADVTITAEGALSMSGATISIGGEETESITIGADAISMGSMADEVSIGGGSTSVISVSAAAVSLGAG